MRNDAWLWLKFSGKELDIRSVPIYELGDTLVAIQRIIHKTHIAQSDQPKKRAILSRVERQKLSLQISDRRKSSDLYALAPFLADQALQEYLLTLLKIGIGSLAKYALKDVLTDNAKQQQITTNTNAKIIKGSALTGSIYAETVQITNHIYNIGNIESIELIPNDKIDIEPVKITKETQEYVRGLAGEKYYGPQATLSGHVTRIYANKYAVQIKTGPGRYVEVRLDEDNLRFVRYDTQEGQELTFAGNPVYRFDTRTKGAFKEFEAKSVEITTDALEDPLA